MVKNPLKRKKKKNPFEASLLIDNPDIKVVEARFDEKPFLIAVGKSEQRKKKVVGEVRLPLVGKGEYQSQKDLKWQVMYNLNALPPGFIPEEKLQGWIGGTVALTSGSIAVFKPETKFIEMDQEKWEEAKYEDVKGLDPIGWEDFMQKVDEAQQMMGHIFAQRKKKPKSK